ncbi:MAG: FAD-binding oxidoreductase [Gammaproteobacteria bacterium]|jgi:glycine/D-amino acid oxidase-like deaminating enzyme|nr:FAD-binding oxidoreductase [Gammaproteobacteria bacterium]
MDRRSFSKMLAGLALAKKTNIGAAVLKEKITIIGGGIIGLSIGYQLSKAGAEITLIEKDFLGAHASGSSFSWINASYDKKPLSYNYLARLGITAYHQLQEELNLDIKWGGSLEWFKSEKSSEQLRDQVKLLQNYQDELSIRIINHDQASKLESFINFKNSQTIAYSIHEGAMNTLSTIKNFSEGIKNNGGKIVFPVEFKKLQYRGSSLDSIKTSDGEIKTDQVIFACGINTDDILNSKMMRTSTPGIILTTKPIKPLINKIIVGPGIHIHQQNDGRIIIGEQGGPGMLHDERLKNKPNTFPNHDYEKKHQDRILKIVKEIIPKLNGLEIEKTTIGWRPLPKDGKPILGPIKELPGVYLAVMHSGISLAAIIGNLVKEEILEARANRLLEDFRPSRFT